MPYVRTNDIQTYYEEDPGPEEASGEPLVLLHGFTGSIDQWARVRPLLAAEHHLICYDLRGHGRSDAPDDLATYSIAAYVADLRDLLDALPGKHGTGGIEDCVLLGSAFGGMVALEFALAYPERVHALVLADSSAGPRSAELSESIAAYEDGIARALAYAGGHGLTPEVEREMQTIPQLRADPQRQERFHAQWQRMSLHGFLGAGKARNERPDRHHDLERLTMPVLIVAGDRDVLVPAAEYMHAHIPRSALRLINHAGHPAMADEPHGFVAMVRGFLAGLDPEHQRRLAPEVTHKLRGEDWGMRTRP